MCNGYDAMMPTLCSVDKSGSEINHHLLLYKFHWIQDVAYSAWTFFFNFSQILKSLLLHGDINFKIYRDNQLNRHFPGIILLSNISHILLISTICYKKKKI